MASKPWVLVCPSSRGIGLAFTRKLLVSTSLPILATTRREPSVTRDAILDTHAESVGIDHDALSQRLRVLRCDVTDEASIQEASRHAADLFPRKTHHLHLACVIPGLLHPEKSPAQVTQASALDSFQVNAIGPLLVAKHFIDFLPRRATNTDEKTSPLPKHATWLSMAARVGSTSDNRSGGWYSYRASKAAVISLTKSLDHFVKARSGDKALAMAYHPGTVKTDFSREFWRGVPEGKLFSPEYAVVKMMDVICGLDRAQRGQCLDWKGEEVPP